MKLEAVNGNLNIMATLKVPAALDQKAERAEKAESVQTKQEMIGNADDEGEAEGEEDEGSGLEEMEARVNHRAQKDQQHMDAIEAGEDAAGGKKKGTRKKRSLNWEEAERALLVEVIKPKADYVENRSVDTKSIKSKRLAWMQITKQFNTLNFRHRSLEQIQVQWRSMKNSAKREYQQKHPKAGGALEGLQMLEFMEELQKDTASARGQTRGSASSVVHIKKELLEIDDEDTPLAALPATSNSDDTLQSSTLALPSPPPSAESQNAESQQAAPPTRQKKKKSQQQTHNESASSTPKQKLLATVSESNLNGGCKLKRQRSQNATQIDGAAATPTIGTYTMNSSASTTETKPTSTLTLATLTTPPPSPPAVSDDKYKKQLFELLKRARLAELDYARREHEQKMRHSQEEHDLKLRQMSEAHEQHMRFSQVEHEARMRAYNAAGVSGGGIKGPNAVGKLCPE